tara:strand:- start:12442 stop:12876 length:435 start_codon:yes stop_codon:yes gene_type:complete
MIKTTELRTELVRRLESLRSENGYTADIQAVLTPVQVRSSAERPASGNYCVLWTEPGQLVAQQGSKIQWQQTFAVDMPVPWTADAERQLDAIRLELASALAGKLAGVQKQELAGLVTAYPQDGRSHAVVSAELTLTYVETLTPL